MPKAGEVLGALKFCEENRKQAGKKDERDRVKLAVPSLQATG